MHIETYYTSGIPIRTFKLKYVFKVIDLGSHLSSPIAVPSFASICVFRADQIQNNIGPRMAKVTDSTRLNVDLENKQSTQTTNWNLNSNDLNRPIAFGNNAIIHDVFGSADSFSSRMAEEFGFVHSTDDIINICKKYKTKSKCCGISSGGCSHPTIPKKSKKRYQESWKSFCTFLNLELMADSYKPTTDDIIMYLDFQASLGKRP